MDTISEMDKLRGDVCVACGLPFQKKDLAEDGRCQECIKNNRIPERKYRQD